MVAPKAAWARSNQIAHGIVSNAGKHWMRLYLHVDEKITLSAALCNHLPLLRSYAKWSRFSIPFGTFTLMVRVLEFFPFRHRLNTVVQLRCLPRRIGDTGEHFVLDRTGYSAPYAPDRRHRIEDKSLVTSPAAAPVP